MNNCDWKFSLIGFVLMLLRYAITVVIMKKKKKKKGTAKGDIYSGFWFPSNIISVYQTVYYVFPTILVELYLTAPLKSKQPSDFKNVWLWSRGQGILVTSR